MALQMERPTPQGSLLDRQRLELRLPDQWRYFDFGTEGQLLPKYDFDLQLEIERKPDAEVGWTHQNRQFAHELDLVAASLPQLGHEDKILYALQTCGIGDGLLAMRVQHHELLSLRDFPKDREELEIAAKTTVVGIGLAKCRWAEQYAYTTAIIPGLNPTNALLIAGITHTSDNKLALGQRKSKYSPGLGAFGGTYNNETIGSSVNSPFPSEVQRDENITETGAPDNSISITMAGITYDSYVTTAGVHVVRPVILSDVWFDGTAAQLTNYFDNNPKAQIEHSGIVFVDNTHEGIMQFLDRMNPSDLVQPAHASLAVALRRTMGINTI